MRVFRGQNLDELGSNAGALFENERVSRPGSGHFFGGCAGALSCCCWCGSNFRVAMAKKKLFGLILLGRPLVQILAFLSPL